MLHNTSSRYAVVIGGSRGIGAETSRLLAYNGYNVAISYNKSKDKAIKLLQQVIRKAPESFIFHIDVLNYKSVKQAAQEVATKFPKLNTLVYSAGILQVGTIETLSPEEWEKVIKINLTGAYYVIKEFLPLLKKAGKSSIIAISSIAGETGNVIAGPAYSASKAGLIGLVKRLAIELAPYNIRVNAVAPSFVETDMTKQFLEKPEDRKKIENLHPLKTILQPRDIAEAILFLADNEKARAITGQVLSINAGRRT